MNKTPARRVQTLVDRGLAQSKNLMLTNDSWADLDVIKPSVRRIRWAMLYSTKVHPVFYKQLLYKQQGFKNLQIKQSEGLKIEIKQHNT